MRRKRLVIELTHEVGKLGNLHRLAYSHGCQNPDLDPTILRFYDLTYLKRSKSFKNLYGRSGSVGSYDSDDPKQSWFLVILFNLIKGSVGPK